MSLVAVSPDRTWPLHDAAASRAVEAGALASAAPGALMALAGFAVARLAFALAPHARRIDVHVGPGNNGGDGLVAAVHLQRAGKAVRVLLPGNAERRPADAQAAFDAAQAAGVAMQDGAGDGAPPDLAIDALLGLGAARPPAGAIAAAIARMNAGDAPVLAVDLPSGLGADTGRVLGDAAVRAGHTLSLLTLKPGLWTGAGRDHAGCVWLDALGVDAGAGTARLAAPPTPAARAHASHKGSYGDVAVVGGARGMTGAAWLAARAAHAAGAGRVYCSLLDPDAPLLDPERPELMGRAAWWASAPATLAGATVVCGCGGGGVVRDVLPPLIAHAARLLLDADALNAVAADAQLQALLAARAARARPTVLTPHPLEAARLLGMTTAAVQADRLAAAAHLARRYAAVVVLKGSGTIVAGADARLSVNPTGNALLATAGTGDVLAGWIGALWAAAPEAAHDSAAAAVWAHGRAADLRLAAGGRSPLRAADLVDAIARATR